MKGGPEVRTYIGVPKPTSRQLEHSKEPDVLLTRY